MLRIDCPHCGDRAEVEFRYGGQAHIQRPGGDEVQVTDQAWANYLFYRENTKGEHRERWLHEAGCRQWFNLVRDTQTHRIVAIYAMGADGPDGRGPLE